MFLAINVKGEERIKTKFCGTRNNEGRVYDFEEGKEDLKLLVPSEQMNGW